MEKITDKTTIPASGFCYSYRDHVVLIEAGFCTLTAEISFNNKVVRSGACGYGLKSAIEKINALIDTDIRDN